MAHSKYKVVSIDTLSIRIVIFLARKLHYRKQPKSVPLLMIAKATRSTYDEVRERIKILLQQELIEKWTVSDAPNHKKTYFRLKYPDPTEISTPSKKDL